MGIKINKNAFFSMIAIMVYLFTFYSSANANLIQNGNFEGGVINGPEFILGTSDKGKWYALAPWTVQPGGPSGSSFYFDYAGGGGSDQRAFQPIDTSSLSLSGQHITLSFDYIFQPGAWQIQSMEVALVGLSGAGAKYAAYGGLGLDGYDVGWYGPDIATARSVLGTLSLSQTGTNWGSSSLSTVVDKNYDVIIAIFSASTWSGSGGLRGIDNVNVSAQVSEPITIFLFGSGLLFLAGLRRKFKN
jgi:hypothetical protein